MKFMLTTVDTQSIDPTLTMTAFFLYGFVNFQSNQNKLTMLKLAKTVIDFPVMAFRV